MENQNILDSGVLNPENREVRPRHIASKGKRFANYLIDRIFILFLTFLLGIFLAVINPNIIISRLEDYLISALIVFVYYILFESMSGRSLGKLITKTKVVNIDFSSPDSSTILKRTLCRFIPFEAFSFLGSSDRGWHDTITDTYVVELESIS